MKKNDIFVNVIKGIDAVITEEKCNTKKDFVTVIGITKNSTIAFVYINEKNRYWELPGGAIESGETVLQAAKREFEEETGLFLKELLEVLAVDNFENKTGNIDSSVAVVVGIINDELEPVISDPEIEKCNFFFFFSDNSTFNVDYLRALITKSLSKYSVLQNSNMWNIAGKEYENTTFISEDDVHYGPLLPGESELKILPLLNGKRILELGCGAGHNLEALRKLGASNGVGIDFCVDQINLAKKRTDSRFSFVLGDFTDSELIEGLGKFDLIISVFAISFVPDINTLVENIAKVLKIGGSIVISTDHPSRKLNDSINSNNEQRLRYWNTLGEEKIPYIHYLHTKEDFIEAFDKFGLTVLKILEPKPLPLERVEDAPYYCDFYRNRYDELCKSPYTIIYIVTKKE